MKLECAVCIWAKRGKPLKAVTIIDGTAACEYHMQQIGSNDQNVRAELRRLPVEGGMVAYQTDEWIREQLENA